MSSPYLSPFEWSVGVVKSIDNVEIKTLDDVFNVIPKLYTKKRFQIKILSEKSENPEEEVYWVKHNSKICSRGLALYL